MEFSEDINSSSSSSSSEEEVLELALIVAGPRQAKVIRPRVNHCEKRDEEFIARFWMSKETTRFMLDLIGEHIAYKTTLMDNKYGIRLEHCLDTKLQNLTVARSSPVSIYIRHHELPNLPVRMPFDSVLGGFSYSYM
ncbi:hypothetical protein V9T40_002343 [Parthenolecanium corni]|uniref:Uncharacterized protein n=1 Tax=Parthenolecanium corni TaxID=536013 RepID=A0AAN9Y5A5_9HEMI